MASTNQDFVMWAGESKLIVIDVVDENGEPKTIETNGTAEWVMQKSVSDVTGKVIKTTSNGISLSNVLIGDSTGGRLTIELLPADTHSKSGIFYHEAKYYDSSLNETVITVGRATIKPSATDTI